MAKEAVSLRDRRKTEENDETIPVNGARLKALRSEKAAKQFKGKKFSNLSPEEKDQLLQAVAITLGIIQE